MNRLRRALLEIWAVIPLAAIAGFLGPFGTYLEGDFVTRFGRWWLMLMGAYVLARPAILLWVWLADATRLPRGIFLFWGMVAASFPMALIWQSAAPHEIAMLVGFTGILPFTLLCSLLVMALTGWAHSADAYLLRTYNESPILHRDLRHRALGIAPTPEPAPPALSQPRTRLHARLTPGFDGAILALESEDHYVRVHGARRSELLLLRLRDAIAEMDDVPGEQTHRSWWVARDAVASVAGAGRAREIVLTNGTRLPVARDSIDRLTRSGFLPAGAASSS